MSFLHIELIWIAFGMDGEKLHHKYIQDAFSNEDALNMDWRLIAGTAWLFSDPGADKMLDFLFVDEAAGGRSWLIWFFTPSSSSSPFIL